MKLTLMIEGSPAVIAAVLAALPSGATVVTDQQELPLESEWLDRGGLTAPIMQAMPVTQLDTADADDGPVDTGAPAFDSAGVPWDARIHASSKATVTDGTWRARRGVDKAVIEAVITELLGQQQPEPVAVPMPTAEAQPMPVMPTAEAQPMPVMPTAEAQPEPMPMPLAPPVEAVVPVTTGPITIPEFMQHLSIQMTGPDAKITNEYLAEAVGKFNAAYGTTFVTVNDFFTAPDKLPALVQMITLDGRW